MRNKKGKILAIMVCAVMVATVLAVAVQAEGNVIFDDQFDDPVLGPDWVISLGRGSYSLTDNPGYLRYIIDAYHTSRTGESDYAKSLWLVRPFSGDQWTLTTEITYNMRPGYPTNNRNAGFTIETPSYVPIAGVHRSTGVCDWNPGSNVITLVAGSNWTQVYFPGSNPLDCVYPLPLERWYIEIERDGDYIAVRASNDGDDSTFEYVVKDTVAPGTFGNDQQIIIEANGWYGSNTPSGYADFDFIRVVQIPTVSGWKTDYSSGLGLDGWTINLYRGGDSYATCTTSGGGYYSFTVTEPGSYSIKEVLKAGWTKTSPGHEVGDPVNDIEVDGYTFTAESGEDVTNKDFTNFEWFEVTACKYDDKTGDGYTGDDTPLSGWYFYLDGTEFGPTDESGCASVTIKDPGHYTVTEKTQDGWTQTGTTSYEFDAESGVDQGPFKFTNFKWFKVSGNKFFDANGDGIKDTNEPGLQHWTITLKKDGDTYGTAETDGNGYYEFTVKDPGSYTVSETLIASWWTQTAPTPVPPGTCSFEAESGSDEEVDFGNWLGPSIVTTTNYCYFDMDLGRLGQEFRLLFTPDVPDNPTLFRLTASNPGQFYYNVFYIGELEAGDEFTIMLPYPFETQGANPVHVYSSLSTNPDGCLIPQGDMSDSFDVFKTTFSIEDYTDTNGDGVVGFGDEATITVTYTGLTPYQGLAYITVHVDYGLKKTGGYQKGANDNALNTPNIENYWDHEFFVSGMASHSRIIENMNVFKHDPGFAGVVTDSMDNPVEGVTVRIFNPSGDPIAELQTDEDGFYSYQYKHRGKPQYYTVQIETPSDYTESKQVLLKAHHIVVVNFQIPIV